MFTEKSAFRLGFEHGSTGRANQVELAQDDPFDILWDASHRAIEAYLRGYVEGSDVRLATYWCVGCGQ